MTDPVFFNPGGQNVPMAPYYQYSPYHNPWIMQTQDLANTQLVVYIQPDGKLKFVFAAIHPETTDETQSSADQTADQAATM